jgi:polar amino acid transport system permease protein
MWNWNDAWASLPTLLRGFVVTVQVSLLASALALIVGLLLAVVRSGRVPVLSHAAWFIVEFLRGTPLLVQLFFAFYVLPQIGLSLSAFTTGVLTLGLSFSAYMAEVYRAGLAGVPVEQWEVARTLGFSPARTWRVVILPQAVRRALLPLGSYVLYLFKETALLSVITVSELLSQAQAYGAQHYRYVEPLVIAGLLYFVISYPISNAIRRMEGRLVSHA